MKNINSPVSLVVGTGVKITIRPAGDGQMSVCIAAMDLAADSAGKPGRKPTKARQGKRKGGTQQ